MEAWTGGAENLLVEQRKVAARASADRNLATVAWIGYDTPDAAEHRGSRFDQGGRRSARLRASRRGRRWSRLVTRNTSRSWHIRTARHRDPRRIEGPGGRPRPLASRAIDPRVPDVHALDVPAGHVWASQSKDDTVANVGRARSSCLGPGFGGDQPLDTGNPVTANRSLVATLPVPPVEPGDPSWGGRTFSSNDSVVDGVPFAGSSGHGRRDTAVEAALQGGTGGVGYLDRGTTSLRNTAATTRLHPEWKEDPVRPRYHLARRRRPGARLALSSCSADRPQEEGCHTVHPIPRNGCGTRRTSGWRRHRRIVEGPWLAYDTAARGVARPGRSGGERIAAQVPTGTRTRLLAPSRNGGPASAAAVRPCRAMPRRPAALPERGEHERTVLRRVTTTLTPPRSPCRRPRHW